MESPKLYEDREPNLKFTFRHSTSEDLMLEREFYDLDPGFENVIDIQELLNGPTVPLEDNPVINIVDQIFPSSELKHVEQQRVTDSTITSSTQAGIDSQNDECVLPIKKVCMTNAKKVKIDSTNMPVNWQILTIKTEDFTHSPVEAKEFAASPESTTFSIDESSSDDTKPQYARRTPGRKPSGKYPNKRKRLPEKDTEEYFDKRARNNVAVRKSREKAKQRQQETEERVQQLASENEQLQKKVDLLSKELHVLKSLFINVGASLPTNFEEILNR
ncbi:hypothetical protein CHS0354_018937 [Potamilus streckersoni]|uniref:BZIP domain-containing protein n=1 Tax=Potamilus streckersoni TaxID=2493646 RepID=A0AAE0VH08_9BIVA|nr:hypothetical protein CHS0354_018937 [Potamilus streckersoni]